MAANAEGAGELFGARAQMKVAKNRVEQLMKMSADGQKVVNDHKLALLSDAAAAKPDGFDQAVIKVAALAPMIAEASRTLKQLHEVAKADEFIEGGASGLKAAERKSAAADHVKLLRGGLQTALQKKAAFDGMKSMCPTAGDISAVYADAQKNHGAEFDTTTGPSPLPRPMFDPQRELRSLEDPGAHGYVFLRATQGAGEGEGRAVMVRKAVRVIAEAIKDLGLNVARATLMDVVTERVAKKLLTEAAEEGEPGAAGDGVVVGAQVGAGRLAGVSGSSAVAFSVKTMNEALDQLVRLTDQGMYQAQVKANFQFFVLTVVKMARQLAEAKVKLGESVRVTKTVFATIVTELKVVFAKFFVPALRAGLPWMSVQELLFLETDEAQQKLAVEVIAQKLLEVDPPTRGGPRAGEQARKSWGAGAQGGAKRQKMAHECQICGEDHWEVSCKGKQQGPRGSCFVCGNSSHRVDGCATRWSVLPQAGKKKRTRLVAKHVAQSTK
jgi:hypothetical protein